MVGAGAAARADGAHAAIAIDTALHINVRAAIHAHAAKPMTKSSIYRVISL
jgi:hypothetical protein